MEYSDKYKRLGRILTQKLRDENYEVYLEVKEYATSISIEDYKQLPRNSNRDPELQKLYDEKIELLNSLNPRQLEILDRLILNLIDDAAFNFLKEIEENLDSNRSIGMTIEGEKVEKINSEFLSGTLFGEYFLWIKEHSKYGKYQH